MEPIGSHSTVTKLNKLEYKIVKLACMYKYLQLAKSPNILFCPIRFNTMADDAYGVRNSRRENQLIS